MIPGAPTAKVFELVAREEPVEELGDAAPISKPGWDSEILKETGRIVGNERDKAKSNGKKRENIGDKGGVYAV